MSVEASAFAKRLERAPNGIRLTSTEKWLFWILADYCNPETHEAWPSIATLTRVSLLNRSTVCRTLNRLEVLKLIETLPQKKENGTAAANHYRFPPFEKELALIEKSSRTVQPPVVAQCDYPSRTVQPPSIDQLKENEKKNNTRADRASAPVKLITEDQKSELVTEYKDHPAFDGEGDVRKQIGLSLEWNEEENKRPWKNQKGGVRRWLEKRIENYNIRKGIAGNDNTERPQAGDVDEYDSAPKELQELYSNADAYKERLRQRDARQRGNGSGSAV